MFDLGVVTNCSFIDSSASGSLGRMRDISWVSPDIDNGSRNGSYRDFHTREENFNINFFFFFMRKT